MLEDAVLFARCLVAKQKLQQKLQQRRQSQKQKQLHISAQSEDADEPDTTRDSEGTAIKEAFDAYEKLRRDRIAAACKESAAVVHSVADSGRWGHWLKTCVIPLFLWAGRAKRRRHFEEHVTRCGLGFAEGEEAEQEMDRVVAVGISEDEDEKGSSGSSLSRLVNAWRVGGLWRMLRMVVWSRS